MVFLNKRLLEGIKNPENVPRLSGLVNFANMKNRVEELQSGPGLVWRTVWRQSRVVRPFDVDVTLIASRKTICSIHTGQQQTTFLYWSIFEWELELGQRTFTMQDLHWMHPRTLHRSCSTNWVCPQVVHCWDVFCWLDFSGDRSKVWEVNFLQWFEEIRHKTKHWSATGKLPSGVR